MSNHTKQTYRDYLTGPFRPYMSFRSYCLLMTPIKGGGMSALVVAGCPFCGAGLNQFRVARGDRIAMDHYCANGSGVTIVAHAQDKESAIELWNRRAATPVPPAPQAAVEPMDILRDVLSATGLSKFLNGDPVSLHSSDLIDIISMASNLAAPAPVADLTKIQELQMQLESVGIELARVRKGWQDEIIVRNSAVADLTDEQILAAARMFIADTIRHPSEFWTYDHHLISLGRAILAAARSAQ